jgi:hypothetical protein
MERYVSLPTSVRITVFQTCFNPLGIKTLETRKLVHREAHSKRTRGQQQDQFELTADGVAIAQQMLGQAPGAKVQTPARNNIAGFGGVLPKAEPRGTPMRYGNDDFVVPESLWTDPSTRPLHVERGRMVGANTKTTPIASARDMARQAALARSASRSTVPHHTATEALDLAVPATMAAPDDEDDVLRQVYQESLASFKAEAMRTPQNVPSEAQQLQAALMASMTEAKVCPTHHGAATMAPHSLPALKLTRKRSGPSTHQTVIELDFDDELAMPATRRKKSSSSSSSRASSTTTAAAHGYSSSARPASRSVDPGSNRLPYPCLSIANPNVFKQTGVSLVVDTRERLRNAKYLHLYARCESKLSEAPSVAGVNCGADRTGLALGDYQLGVRQSTEFGDDSTLNGIKILPCCVERKTINDLVQRSFGRDHQKQVGAGLTCMSVLVLNCAYRFDGCYIPTTLTYPVSYLKVLLCKAFSFVHTHSLVMQVALLMPIEW